MIEALKRWQPRLGVLVLILGAAILLGSLFVAGTGAWIARMLATLVIAGGVQWLPRLEQWLATHVYQRLLLATSLGLMLVWMLLQYRNA